LDQGATLKQGPYLTYDLGLTDSEVRSLRIRAEALMGVASAE